MRYATWNVNSIRARVDRVTDWLARTDVDVLAMQETKCRDEQFPYLAFEAAGYEVAHVGLSQWNGVAIASRVGLADVAVGFTGQPGFAKANPDTPEVVPEPEQEARAIGATCGGIRIWSLYVPNGRALEDPHYQYKLNWLAALHEFAGPEVAAHPQLVLAGDWNVAPTDDDVWDTALFEGKTHVSPAERAAFFKFLDGEPGAGAFADVVRPHTPGPGVYTYWDYTQLRFPKKQGLRIDFALASPELAARTQTAFIDREERKGKGASDHAPVVVELGSEVRTT